MQPSGRGAVSCTFDGRYVDGTAMVTRTAVLAASLTMMLLAGCSGGGGDSTPAPPPPEPLADAQLHQLIDALDLTGDPSTGRNLPSLSDPLPQLGKKLFFSKSLSGDMDTACASCHHPMLGGSGGLSLPIGSGANEPDLVGPGRSHPTGAVARNAPTTFNVALYDSGLFQDSRVESIGKVAGANGAGSGIRTPDTAYNVDDPNAGPNLTAALARFPVTVPNEMKGYTFESGADNQAIRAHIAGRIGNYGAGAAELGASKWLDEFQTAFAVGGAQPEQLITFDNIALALGEYIRTQVFVNTPWRAYVEGNRDALSTAAKRGALMFLRLPPRGAGCVRCHSGDFFTSEEHHVIAFPQVGPGKGDGSGDDDFGRERATGEVADRYRFRTPSLLNVEVSWPYTHAGAYETLEEVIDHYRVPDTVIDEFFAAGGVCALAQFENDADCAARFPNTQANTSAALAKMRNDQMLDPDSEIPEIATIFGEEDIEDVKAFLLALTDPCVKSRACLAPWIPTASEDPDGNQLRAIDRNGNPL
jgi:cytochrome c peroxidase